MSCHPADGPDGLDVGSGEGNAASLRQLLQQHVDQLNNNNLITKNMYDKYNLFINLLINQFTVINQ